MEKQNSRQNISGFPSGAALRLAFSLPFSPVERDPQAALPGSLWWDPLGPRVSAPLPEAPKERAVPEASLNTFAPKSSFPVTCTQTGGLKLISPA